MELQRELEIPIKVGDVERKYTVKFPKVDQYIQVEARKAQLTVPRNSTFDQSAQYLNMIRLGTNSSLIALDLVDMIAWMEVCIPELMKDMVGINSIEELDIMDVKPILDAYKNYFLPWKTAWENVFRGIKNESENKESK